MEINTIKNDQITASSSYNSETYRPWKGRLNNYGHWATASPQATDPWIQFDLTQQTVVTGVIIQGSGTYEQFWVTLLKVQYGESQTTLEYILENGSHKVRLSFCLLGFLFVCVLFFVFVFCLFCFVLFLVCLFACFVCFVCFLIFFQQVVSRNIPQCFVLLKILELIFEGTSKSRFSNHTCDFRNEHNEIFHHP